ncbi:NhaP-type Na+/H+ or K+/H+ antiporter [Geosmithia morbida]|uniref:NhaP-type Na+/H+ or K+/H+ antiporter n=1 Tax=Geosmithia morbida TaxID=1094350 RepID=A0A9P4YX58_9HYPO|nr:NhaP-type Na+/H+ or K+/H+ antiporter [Geosmithia morbida]KAF4123685.1 NhaP-type Na+/H+ or K+/H+ antiporter [Geosmithia morbida]
MPSSLPYHEPSIETILIQSSLLLLLNAVNHILDSVIYAGGLSTDLSALRTNIWLSTCVAATGVAVPIGLSFTLPSLVGGTSQLQAFAAGAALCSTSLGTTFTLLATSGLGSSRLGVVLSSAAMMDDVVGLVMVQIISDLGSGPDVEAATVVRPVLTSLAFAVVLPLAWGCAVVPAARRLRLVAGGGRLAGLADHEHLHLAALTGTLVGVVTGATYAGSSPLLGAYVSGIMVCWWDREAAQRRGPGRRGQSGAGGEHPPGGGHGQVGVDAAGTRGRDRDRERHVASPSSSAAIFGRYYEPALRRVFRPLFFASVGFSIPITEMFTGAIVWRGVVYAILMGIGKMVCGLWLLLRIPRPSAKLQHLAQVARSSLMRIAFSSPPPSTSPPPPSPSSLRRRRRRATAEGEAQPRRRGQRPGRSDEEEEGEEEKDSLSVYPGLMMGSAMMARGEIGYLISSIAEGGGVFASSGSSADADAASGDEVDGPSDLFLVVTWAITLCTVVGPIGLGFLANRVRRLERESSGSDTGRTNVLGRWGVDGGGGGSSSSSSSSS